MHYLHTTISMEIQVHLKTSKYNLLGKKNLDVLHAKAQTYGPNPVTFSFIRGWNKFQSQIKNTIATELSIHKFSHIIKTHILTTYFKAVSQL